MQLFIANTTQQFNDFIYTIPERNGNVTQRIAPGGQIRIVVKNGDLNQHDIDAILNQHRPFGLIEVSEVGKARGHHPLVASVDKPVHITKVQDQFRRNRSVLVDRGKEMRTAAAVALDAHIEEAMTMNGSGEVLRELRFDVEEIKGAQVLDSASRRDGSGMEQALAETPPIGEGVVVTKDEGSDRRPRARLNTGRRGK